MASTRRNRTLDQWPNRCFTADAVVDLASISAKHGDTAYVTATSHAYLYLDGAGWVNLSVVPAANGGTGLASYAVGDLVYASGASALSRLAIGASNDVLIASASGPVWSDIVSVDVLSANSLSVGAITASGLLTTTNGQIKFPAAQNASADANTLDDYEEGTWTPVLSTDGVDFTSVTYDTQTGTYIKIGRLVTVQFILQTDAVTIGAATGSVRLTGLPFTAANWGTGAAVSFSWASNPPCFAFVAPGGTSISFRTDNNATNTAAADVGTGANANFVAASLSFQV